MTSEISGEPLHTRCLAVAFTQEAGDSIGFRADLFDLRRSGVMELAGRIASAGIIHKMELHGAFSGQDGRLERITWNQSHVMHEANRATRGECCRDPMARLTGLVGTPLGGEFAGALKRHFGGPLGCTHINTLFQELSAFAARFLEVLRAHPALPPMRTAGERLARRSVFFDAFLPDEAFLPNEANRPATTRLAVRLSDFFFAARDAAENEKLLRHDEVRVVADAELATWQLRSLSARERSRSGPECSPAPWQSRNEALHDLSTGSLRSGITRAFLERFGERREDAALLSALLCLAPGMTQVGAALSDALTPSSSARPGGLGSLGPGPCYMLRAEGPLVETLFGRDGR